MVSEECLETYETSSLRYRHVLYFVAHRVLGNYSDAETAVESCIISVSGNVPSFKNEGSFRGWLVRVLIDEALAILRKKRMIADRDTTAR